MAMVSDQPTGSAAMRSLACELVRESGGHRAPKRSIPRLATRDPSLTWSLLRWTTLRPQPDSLPRAPPRLPHPEPTGELVPRGSHGGRHFLTTPALPHEGDARSPVP